MSRHRAPETDHRPVRSILQAGITDSRTVVDRRPLPPVPPVAAAVTR